MSRAEKVGAATDEESGAAGAAASPFERFDNSDVRALIEAYPLAWVCAGSGSTLDASLLPLVGVYDASGKLTDLIGHMAVGNPLYAALSGDPRATVLFRGPDAYISPEHAGRRDWGPTWNYAQLRIGAKIGFDADFTEHALVTLLGAVESGRAEPWHPAELGERYDPMLARIIGFRAKVTTLSGRFKLGQDETPETLNSILAKVPDDATKAWMRRFNAGR